MGMRKDMFTLEGTWRDLRLLFDSSFDRITLGFAVAVSGKSGSGGLCISAPSEWWLRHWVGIHVQVTYMGSCPSLSPRTCMDHPCQRLFAMRTVIKNPQQDTSWELFLRGQTRIRFKCSLWSSTTESAAWAFWCTEALSAYSGSLGVSISSTENSPTSSKNSNARNAREMFLVGLLISWVSRHVHQNHDDQKLLSLAAMTFSKAGSRCLAWLENTHHDLGQSQVVPLSGEAEIYI